MKFHPSQLTTELVSLFLMKFDVEKLSGG